MIYPSIKLYRIKQRNDKEDHQITAKDCIQLNLSKRYIGHTQIFDDNLITTLMSTLLQMSTDNRILYYRMPKVCCRKTKSEEDLYYCGQ